MAVLLVVGILGASPCGAAEKGWMVGTEVDLVPFLYDGYYVSLIGGAGKLRGRVVRTELTLPSFVTDDAFRDDDRKVDALILDVYFRPDFEGWWVGPGLERWTGDVTEVSSGLRRGYRTDVLTLGGGYTWRFSEHFYLNPWAAVHVPIGGDRDVQFADNTFEIDPTPEISVKLGIRF
ncbi:hypothetical protein ABI59_22495 [Acidobacteria bacterium Mor1]|nr:hypothetical protein ABI59_22495 [Acidobacteria bacterium Mor1]